ncbi:MAG: general secretion pathway protein [Gammaproteobacteria bacterium]|nr:general secretion pathway protein [Gammaproteobacteria bacterium]NIR90065.1 general secretion pathway protein [Gammaproteobacteria bacterium]NIU03269.1 general secretion pathway protein [Gammaproteobacteria bacterium]NIV50763.1 general secretion pathway protein [Gammaproteobacteria bacterium]NIV75349.1 general secretion pathway protein [Gammaproteobacteria bacterium]
MTKTLTPVQSRLLAVAILLLALAGVYVLVVWPLLAQHRTYDEAIAELTYRLQRYQGMAVQSAALREGLDEVKQQQATSSYYLKSSKAALASAELQQHVKARVADHNGQLVSSQVMPDAADDAFPSVAIRVHMRGDIRSLRAILHALEMGTPLVFVDEVFITQGPRRRSRRDEREANSLDIRFKVTGYMRGESA